MPILTRAVYKPVKVFIEQYSLSKGHAYQLIAMPGFPSIKVGKSAWRVDMSKVDDWMEKRFGR